MADEKIPLEKLYRAIQRAQKAGDAEAVEHFQGLAQAQVRDLGGDPTADMGTGDRLVAGVGRGLANVGMNVGDIAGRVPGLGGLRPSAQTWEDFNKASEPLLETTAGQVGNFAGEMAATLPIGGLAGAGIKGAAMQTGSRLLRPLATGIGKTAIEGSAIGGVLGGPEGHGTGALIGAAGGAALHGAGKLAAKGVRTIVDGLVTPTPAARYLQSKGVDLTLGQLNPETMFAQAEEIATSMPLKSVVQGQRRAGVEGWQNAVMNEARAPGAPAIDPKAAIADQLGSARAGFEEAYGQIKGFKVGQDFQTPRGRWTTVSEALMEAPKNRSVRATGATRKSVADFLRNETSILPKKPGTAVDAEALQAIRSNIRKEIRATLKGNTGREDAAAADMLRDAEGSITRALDTQLPEDLSAGLRATDRAYGKHRIVSDAIRRSKDMPSGVTPSKLSDAVAAGTESRAYEVGGGGELRKLAAAGRDALEGRIPTTGARILGATPLSFASPLLNLAPAKRALTGATATQLRARALLAKANRKLGQAGRQRLRDAESLSIAALTGRTGD